jgi:glycosyltransferase involved in cell wall biosynthesis
MNWASLSLRAYHPAMRIVHVITRLIIGGAQENTLLTCAGLHARGHDVTLITGPTTGPEGTLMQRARSSGYRVIEVPELIRSIRPWTDARARRVLAQHYRELKPDVVHTHSSKAGIVGRWAAVDAGVPHIVHTIHGMSFNRTQPWWMQRLGIWLERRAAKHTDRIVTVADAMIAQSVEAGVCRRDQCLTVYSGMEVGPFYADAVERAAVRQSWGVPDDAIVIGTVARLFKNKGYELLLPIMSQVTERLPQARFVWIGDGAQRPLYEEDLRHRELLGKTTLVGLIRPDEVPWQLKGLDILAHASLWEGLPRAVVQALLTEVPVVAWSLDGTPEVVHDHQTGRLIQFDDLDAFAEAVVELGTDANLRERMGRAGRDLCRQRFSHERMVTRLEQLYEELCA